MVPFPPASLVGGSSPYWFRRTAAYVGGFSGAVFPYRVVARLLANGATDTTFDGPRVSSSGGVRALVRDERGGLLLAGSLRLTNDAVFRMAARLELNGRLDPAFEAMPADGSAYGMIS